MGVIKREPAWALLLQLEQPVPMGHTTGAGLGEEAASRDIEKNQVVMGSEWTKAVTMDQPHMLLFIHPNIYSLIHSNSVMI